MSKLLISISCYASLFLTACSMEPVTNILPNVYKIDVEQGNIVTQKMIDQLQPGMKKRQVRYLLGTPLLVDVFHQKRWDYLYTKQPGGKARLQKRISLFFKNDQLAGLQGDFKPEMVELFSTRKETTSVLVPERKKEKTLYQKTLGVIGMEKETPEEAVDAETKEAERSLYQKTLDAIGLGGKPDAEDKSSPDKGEKEEETRPPEKTPEN